MPKCSFCGEKLPLGAGKMFVKTDGRVYYFDRSKCEKNFKMGREGASTKWTSLYRKVKEKGKK